MKKTLKLTFLALAFSIVGLSNVSAADYKGANDVDPQDRVIELETRVKEIWKSDLREISDVDKMALQQELKEIKKEIKEYNKQGLDSKLTVSVGGAIIILLLLIIIL